MLEWMQDILNYESRMIGRLEPNEANGIGVSTAYTSDEGYETALLDNNGAHPVERYKTKEQAIAGHNWWVKEAKNLKKDDTVTKLGAWGVIKESEYRIKPVISH